MNDLETLIESCQEATLQRNYARCMGRILQGRMDEYSPRERERIYKNVLKELQKDE